MSIEIFYKIFFTTWASSLIPLSVYFIHRKSTDKEIRIIVALIIVSVVFNGLAYAGAIYLKSSILTNNIYKVLAFFLFCWFYHEILFKKLYKKFFLISITVFVLTFLMITFFAQNFLTEHQTLSGAVYKCILFIYAIIYLNHLVLTLPMNNPYKNGLFWINNGVLFCDGFAIFLYIIHGYNLKTIAPENTVFIWSLFNISNIVQNILFAIGIYFSQRKIKVYGIQKQAS